MGTIRFYIEKFQVTLKNKHNKPFWESLYFENDSDKDNNDNEDNNDENEMINNEKQWMTIMIMMRVDDNDVDDNDDVDDGVDENVFDDHDNNANIEWWSSHFTQITQPHLFDSLDEPTDHCLII